jgi:hypothetical protein
MKLKDLQVAYNNFFIKSDAGKEFLKFLAEQIDLLHRNAEAKPELSRDFAQRAAGLRMVEEHLTSVLTQKEVKKG